MDATTIFASRNRATPRQWRRSTLWLGLLLCWLAGFPSPAAAATATPTPTPGAGGRISVVKELCRSLEGYTLEALKRELELAAKRDAANELFGELIVASTTVQNWTVTEDQLRSQSLGLVRVEGSPVYRQQRNPPQLCVTLTVYATPRDFARFEPLAVRGRACASAAALPLPQVRAQADEAARLRALRDYDPRLADYASATVLPLLRQMRYLENNVAPDTDNYCVAVQGVVIPIEVDGFVLDAGALAQTSPTPEPASPTATPDAPATVRAEKTALERAVAATLTAAALTAAPTATPAPNATATARAEQTAVAQAVYDSLTATAQARAVAVPEVTLARQANIRSGPGTEFTVLGAESQGARFAVMGRNPAGDWWEIDYNGRSAWVSAGLVTPRNTAAVAVSANLPAPPPTPTPLPAPQLIYHTITLDHIANTTIREGYSNPPFGNTWLNGVKFYLSDASLNTAMTQTEGEVNARLPTTLALTGLNIANPRSIHLLITGGNVRKEYAGRQVGRVVVEFSNGQSITKPIIVGQQLREWHLAGDRNVVTTSDPAVSQVYADMRTDGVGACVIDMLTIQVPEALRSQASLTAVSIHDESVQLIGDLKPAVNLLGLTVLAEE